MIARLMARLGLVPRSEYDALMFRYEHQKRVAGDFEARAAELDAQVTTLRTRAVLATLRGEVGQ